MVLQVTVLALALALICLGPVPVNYTPYESLSLEQKPLVMHHLLNVLEISAASSTLSAIRNRCTVMSASFIIFLL